MANPEVARPKPALRLLDSKTLAELVGQKHHTGLDPNDPVFMVAAVLTELQSKAKDDLGKLITEAAAAIAASTGQGDAAAQARADRIITDAGRWASEQIRSAAQDGTTQIAAHLEPLVTRAEAAGKRAVLGAWIAAAGALACIASAGIVVWFV